MKLNKQNLEKAFLFVNKPLLSKNVILDVTNGLTKIRQGNSFINEKGEFLEEILYKKGFSLTLLDIFEDNDVTDVIKLKLEDGLYKADFHITLDELVTIKNIEKYITKIKIQGLLSNKVKNSLGINTEEDNWYFTSYSEENLLAGKYGEYELLETSDQFGSRYNYIPRGCKMISKIKGINNDALKITDSWGFKEQISIPFALNHKYLSDKELIKIGKVLKKPKMNIDDKG